MKKVEITFNYEDLTMLLDLIEEGLKTKNKKNKELKKEKNLYFRLVNIWRKNGVIEDEL